MNKYLIQALLILFGTAIGFGANQIFYGQKLTSEMNNVILQVNNNSKDIQNSRENQREWNTRQDKDIEQIRKDDAANHTVQQEFIQLLKTNYELLCTQSKQNAELLKQLQVLMRKEVKQ